MDTVFTTIFNSFFYFPAKNNASICISATAKDHRATSPEPLNTRRAPRYRKCNKFQSTQWRNLSRAHGLEQWSSKSLIDQQRRRIFPDEIIRPCPSVTTFTFTAGQRLSKDGVFGLQRLVVLWVLNCLKMLIWVFMCYHFGCRRNKRSNKEIEFGIVCKDCAGGGSRVRLGAWWHLEWPLRRGNNARGMPCPSYCLTGS